MKRKLINRKSMGAKLHYLNHHYLRRTLVRPLILFSKAEGFKIQVSGCSKK